jgi:hypothetical protein
MKTKQISIIVLLSLLSINSNSQACNPDLDKIYSFEIGSVFQYKKTSTSSNGGHPLTYTIVEKYSVIDKWKSNDTIAFVRDVIKLSFSSPDVLNVPVIKRIYRYNFYN